MEGRKRFGLTVYQPDKVYQGFTLFSPLEGTSTYLIDMRGNVVHRWQMPYRPGEYAELLSNGNLLFGGRTGKGTVNIGGRGGIVMEVDWEGHTVWEYAEDSLHHDFCRMENGNTMVLGWELVPPDVAKSIKGGKPGTEDERGIWCDYFREVDKDGQTVWEWHAYEHLDLQSDAMCPLHRRDEWTHRQHLRGPARRQHPYQLPVVRYRGVGRQRHRPVYLEVGQRQSWDTNTTPLFWTTATF